MMNKSKPMSATARAVLTLAATSNDHLVQLPHMPVAAARQVVRSMLKAGLVEEPPALVDDARYKWRTTENGEVLGLRATAGTGARRGRCERCDSRIGVHRNRRRGCS